MDHAFSAIVLRAHCRNGGDTAAEIVFDYSLGDYLRDLVVGLFRGAEGKVMSQLQRAEARYKSAVSKIKTRTGLKAL